MYDDTPVKTSTSPDLEKLRRFTLAVALVLITYSFAGVKPITTGPVRLLGIPFSIDAIEWLPVGLWLACLFSGIRFLYYSVALTEPPWRVRGAALGLVDLDSDLRYVPPQVDEYSEGPKNDRESDPHPEHDPDRVYSAAVSQWSRIRGSFPHIPGLGDPTPDICDDEEHSHGRGTPYLAGYKYPWRLRLAVWFQDLDYTSPIWLSVLACLAGGWKMFGDLILGWVPGLLG